MLMLERFTVSRKRRTALSFLHAIPDGKPLHTFPGIALDDASMHGPDILARFGKNKGLRLIS
jgi:hypothetical protein